MTKFLSVFFTIFFLMSTASAKMCRELFFAPDKVFLQKAFQNGMKVYEKNRDILDFTKDGVVYLHATSVDGIARSLNSTHFLGSPLQDFQRMANLFDIYKDSMVIYSLSNRTHPLTQTQLAALKDYGQLASQRFVIQRQLKAPLQKLKSYFIFEVLEALKFGIPVKDVIAHYQNIGEFENQRSLLDELSALDWEWVRHEIEQRQGVILVIDRSVEHNTVIERDHEHDGAWVLFGKRGIPIRSIKAIIPLSEIEKRELIDLLKP